MSRIEVYSSGIVIILSDGEPRDLGTKGKKLCSTARNGLNLLAKNSFDDICLNSSLTFYIITVATSCNSRNEQNSLFCDLSSVELAHCIHKCISKQGKIISIIIPGLPQDIFVVVRINPTHFPTPQDERQHECACYTGPFPHTPHALQHIPLLRTPIKMQRQRPFFQSPSPFLNCRFRLGLLDCYDNFMCILIHMSIRQKRTTWHFYPPAPTLSRCPSHQP